ncbi:hypothetical protein U9396_26585, partial [Escherichia coli]
LASISNIALSLISMNKKAREAYYTALSHLLGVSKGILIKLLKRAIIGLTMPPTSSLFELDTG